MITLNISRGLIRPSTTLSKEFTSFLVMMDYRGCDLWDLRRRFYVFGDFVELGKFRFLFFFSPVVEVEGLLILNGLNS